VLRVPTRAAVILETVQIAAVVGALAQIAVAAEGILQVGVHLDLLGELGGLDFNEGGADGLHVGVVVVEHHSARTDGVLVLIRVDAGVDDALEEILENVGEGFGAEHSMKGANEDGFSRIESCGGTPHIGRISNNPRNDLHLLITHSLGGYLVIPGTAARPEILRTGQKQVAYLLFIVENNVEIAFGHTGHVFARPFDTYWSKRTESLDQILLGDVPGYPAEEDLDGQSLAAVTARG